MRYYTKDHEWIDVDGVSATVGITAYAQEQLGDIVFVEVPASGAKVAKGGDAAVVESVKAASCDASIHLMPCPAGLVCGKWQIPKRFRTCAF